MSFSNFESLDKQLKQSLSEAENRKNLCVSCPVCSSQFFEEAKITKFMADHNLVLGQAVPQNSKSLEYRMLKCVHCSNYLEPRILFSGRDPASEVYYDLLNTLEGKKDSRTKENNTSEKEKNNDEVESQKL